MYTSYMRKVVAAVFAHPDDEAFGPGGTLAKLALTHDVFIITATGGEAGQCDVDDPDHNLSDLRKHELLSSAKILGIKRVFFLGFEDGTLSNSLYHEIASKVEEKLIELQPDIVITFEAGGVSGHIDHITISFVTTYVTLRLKKTPKLYYYCITTQESKTMGKDYFIYFPTGYDPEKVDWTNDISEVWETKKSAMLAHKSQKHDANRVLKTLKNLPKKEHFLLFKS